CFCAASSAVYVLNDWTDRAADRRHPSKRHRPLAAGIVTPAAAAALAAGLALSAILPALLFLPSKFLMVLLGYVLLNLAYSFGLKRIAIVDVMVIAVGFVLRIYAGGAVIAVMPTVWIVACTLLLALFLALAKRRDDLVRGVDDAHRASLAGYNQAFVDT